MIYTIIIFPDLRVRLRIPCGIRIVVFRVKRVGVTHKSENARKEGKADVGKPKSLRGYIVRIKVRSVSLFCLLVLFATSCFLIVKGHRLGRE